MKEPIQVIVLDEITINLFDESEHKIDSTDNFKTYEKTFFNGDEKMLTSLIGIEVIKDNVLISSCLIGSEGGETGIEGDSTLISYGGLVVCCSNTVFKLTLPDLNLEWKTVSDLATCLGIYYLDKDYVVHGEHEISRLSNEGKIVWQQGGRDIFVTAEGINDFSVYEDYILATDWEYNQFKIDFDGKILDEYKVEPIKGLKNKEDIKVKKWWKLW